MDGKTIIAVVIIIVSSIAAIVVMSALHDDPALLIGLVGPMIPTLISVLAWKEAASANVNAANASQSANSALHQAIGGLTASTPLPTPPISTPTTEGNAA